MYGMCFVISSQIRKGENKAKINIQITANISISLELQYVTVCVFMSSQNYQECRMKVNIASRVAILIMDNIVQYIVDDYEPLARPTKLQAHSLQDAFSFTRSIQTTLHY